MTNRRNLIASVVLALFAQVGHTHSVLEHTTPTSGSVLERSPPELKLSFHEPTRLTLLAVQSATGERRLQFSPNGESMSFTATEPELGAGRNEVQWRALSQDGHVVEGSIILVVKPPTP